MTHTIPAQHFITLEAAKALVPDLVTFATTPGRMDTALWEKINAIEVEAKKGQEVIVAIHDYLNPSNTKFVRAKVSLVTRDWRNEDGPVIRVKAGNVSWRVDGSGDHFLPIK